ncbi:hypothetical protein JCM10213v2_006079 [Rhodosporidiobolus nylandii]
MLRTTNSLPAVLRAQQARAAPAFGSLALLVPASPASRNFSSTARTDKQKLAVVGSGWAGYEILRKVDKKRYDVTLISPNTYFAFTPLLASASVGTVAYSSTLEPTYHQAWVDGIDIKNKVLTCQPATCSGPISEVNPGSLGPATAFRPFKLSYDKLVIATGAYSQTFGIPGVKDHAHFLKDIKDAARIRARILEVFELAAQPTVTDDERKGLLNFVVVGGGPTGIEWAGELHDFLTSDLVHAFPTLAPLARITVYDTAPQILGSFDKSLSEYATQKFDREGIRVHTGRHVTSVSASYIEIKEEGTIPYGLLVWSTGLAPNPLIESIKELKHDEKTHSLLVTEHFNPLNVETGNPDKNIFVVGDCSAMPERLPATAQVASQQARWLVKILNSQVRNRDPPGPFEYNNRGAMAYIGGWNAILDRTKAQKGPQGELTGRAAWLAWRGAYWTQSLSTANKIALLYNWFGTWLLGRRLTRF